MQIFSTSIIELALLSALHSLFLDFCFREGNIFDGWLEFWYRQSVPGKIREQLDSQKDVTREDRFEHINWFWFKPLGGCVVCMNVWISFAVCAIWIFFGALYLCEVLPIVLLSSFIVRYFHEKIL